MSNTPVPCSLCHFCVQADMENRGSVCVWYNTYIAQDEVHEFTPLREACYNDKDGDNFVWKLTDLNPIEYAKWKQGISLMVPNQRRANIAISISIISLIISVALKYA